MGKERPPGSEPPGAGEAAPQRCIEPPEVDGGRGWSGVSLAGGTVQVEVVGQHGHAIGQRVVVGGAGAAQELPGVARGGLGGPQGVRCGAACALGQAAKAGIAHHRPGRKGVLSRLPLREMQAWPP